MCQHNLYDMQRKNNLGQLSKPEKTYLALNLMLSHSNNISNSYLAIDDLDIGTGNRIPLWMFGLQY